MYELTIELRSDTGRCLYEQIYDHIKQEIRVGRLSVGERLPSTRSLAEYLQVARSTVDLAYEQLVSEGYIEARPYKGYFVCRVEELFQFTEAEAPGRYPENHRQGSSHAEIQGMGKHLAKRRQGGTGQGVAEFLYDFSPSKIDMSLFPFSVWKKITKNIFTLRRVSPYPRSRYTSRSRPSESLAGTSRTRIRKISSAPTPRG